MTTKSWKFQAAVFAVALGVSSAAQAQATRTWVSGVGDDVNPCSRTAPCKTWAGAISKTAAGGYIDALDPGGFGGVTITKSITLDGGGSLAGVLVSGTPGITISAAATDHVVLRNLSIEGGGTGTIGIRVLSGRANVENCIISGFSSRGIESTTTGALVVNDTVVTESLGAGIFVQNGLATLDNVRLQANSVGIRASTGSIVTARATLTSSNGTGFIAEGGTTHLNIEASLTNYNNLGISVTGGAVVTVSNTSIINNVTGLMDDGSSFLLSFLNNRLAENTTDGAFTGSVPLH